MCDYFVCFVNTGGSGAHIAVSMEDVPGNHGAKTEAHCVDNEEKTAPSYVDRGVAVAGSGMFVCGILLLYIAVLTYPSVYALYY